VPQPFALPFTHFLRRSSGKTALKYAIAEDEGNKVSIVSYLRSIGSPQ
jgi:hypothetical protein